MFNLGTPELILVLVILVLLFGASKLPKLAKSFGTSARELRKGLNGEEDEKPAAATTSAPQSKDV
jgi:sec-independent protein translocase protein TatA